MTFMIILQYILNTLYSSSIMAGWIDLELSEKHFPCEECDSFIWNLYQIVRFEMWMPQANAQKEAVGRVGRLTDIKKKYSTD